MIAAHARRMDRRRVARGRLMTISGLFMSSLALTSMPATAEPTARLSSNRVVDACRIRMWIGPSAGGVKTSRSARG